MDVEVPDTNQCGGVKPYESPCTTQPTTEDHGFNCSVARSDFGSSPGWRPRRLPRAFAAAMPERMRSWINHLPLFFAGPALLSPAAGADNALPLLVAMLIE
jgi:hypothetical protein